MFALLSVVAAQEYEHTAIGFCRFETDPTPMDGWSEKVISVQEIKKIAECSKMCKDASDCTYFAFGKEDGEDKSLCVLYGDGNLDIDREDLIHATENKQYTDVRCYAKAPGDSDGVDEREGGDDETASSSTQNRIMILGIACGGAFIVALLAFITRNHFARKEEEYSQTNSINTSAGFEAYKDHEGRNGHRKTKRKEPKGDPQKPDEKMDTFRPSRFGAPPPPPTPEPRVKRGSFSSSIDSRTDSTITGKNMKKMPSTGFFNRYAECQFKPTDSIHKKDNAS